MPPSVGQRLKHAREKMGLSLADVSHQTRIPMPRLKDLEEDSFTSFGSLTYARSFLQTYADLVGVDAHTVTEHMTQTPLSGARDYRYLTDTLGPWVPDKPDRGLMNPVRAMQTPRSFGMVAAIVSAILLLVGGMLVASGWLGNHKAEPKQAVEASLVTPPVVAVDLEVRSAEIIVEKDGQKIAVPKPEPKRALPVESTPPLKALPVEATPSKPRR